MVSERLGLLLLLKNKKRRRSRCEHRALSVMSDVRRAYQPPRNCGNVRPFVFRVCIFDGYLFCALHVFMLIRSSGFSMEWVQAFMHESAHEHVWCIDSEHYRSTV